MVSSSRVYFSSPTFASQQILNVIVVIICKLKGSSTAIDLLRADTIYDAFIGCLAFPTLSEATHSLLLYTFRVRSWLLYLASIRLETRYRILQSLCHVLTKAEEKQWGDSCFFQNTLVLLDDLFVFLPISDTEIATTLYPRIWWCCRQSFLCWYETREDSLVEPSMRIFLRLLRRWQPEIDDSAKFKEFIEVSLNIFIKYGLSLL
jgi:hypothetical protein